MKDAADFLSGDPEDRIRELPGEEDNFDETASDQIRREWQESAMDMDEVVWEDDD